MIPISVSITEVNTKTIFSKCVSGLKTAVAHPQKFKTSSEGQVIFGKEEIMILR